MWNWGSKTYEMCTLPCRCSSSLVQYLNHLACPRNSRLSLTSTQRCWSSLTLQRCVLNWWPKSYEMCTYPRHTYMWKPHLHMHKTHFMSPVNSRLWLLASTQRYWSNFKLQRWCMLNWGTKTYEMCTLCHTCEKLILTCIPTMLPVNETQDCACLLGSTQTYWSSELMWWPKTYEMCTLWNVCVYFHICTCENLNLCCTHLHAQYLAHAVTDKVW